jgi:Kef-type K+ transport system membrane component KefB/mannitol/fructose-specific phosphotransferase system IIA component (Ntr-type)/nucleotide-binding universal stress UspA family protein
MTEFLGLDLPIQQPVLLFATVLAIFLVAPILARQLRVPGIIVLLVAGAVVGPNALNLLARDATIVLLGTVGLLYLVFTAGMEIDLQGFRRQRHRSITFGSVSYLIPQLLGTGVGLLLGYGWLTSILLGSIFGSHTLIAYPIAVRFGISKSPAITTAVGGTIITDSAALLVLAVVAAATLGDLDVGFWVRLTVLLTTYVLLVTLVLPRIARRFFRQEQTGPVAEYIFVLLALFSSAYLASVAGVAPIVGAFLAGLSLNRLIPDDSLLNRRIHFFGEAFFIPFFLLSVGMLVDPHVLVGSARAWEVMLAMTATVVVAKAAAAWLTRAFFGYSRDEGWAIFGLSVPQAAATLAGTLIGVEIGLFDDAILNGAIMMILVTCVIGPGLVSRHGRRIALQEEQAPLDRGQLPQRVIVPISNPATAGGLLSLALMIRERGSTEPLYPLTVVPGGMGSTEKHVVEAEKMLRQAITHVGGADVPVVPLTRVDLGFARGIARGAVEGGATTMVIGWDGRPSIRRGIFGSVLDSVLEYTRQEIFVAKLGHPLNTTRRLIVLVPPGADHMPGFPSSLRGVKLMASRLGAEIIGIAVATPAAPIMALFEAERPAAPVRFQEVADWDALPQLLRQILVADDLVVVFSARAGAIAWTSALDRLPGMLARLVPESFVLIYPAEWAAPLEYEESATLPELPTRVVAPDRIVVGLEDGPLRDIVRRILQQEFADDPARLDRITDRLVAAAPRSILKLRPGAVLLHAHVRGMAEPVTLLGTSFEGLTIEGLDSAVRLVFVLLGSQRGEDHLRQLAAIARLVSEPERVQLLEDARSVDEVVHALRR